MTDLSARLRELEVLAERAVNTRLDDQARYELRKALAPETVLQLVRGVSSLLEEREREIRAAAKEVVEDLVYQFGYKNNNGTIWTGGLSALEGAFDFLGWNDDPHPVDAGMLCDEPGCTAWISCGTPTPTGYRSTCGKHAPGRLASFSSPAAPQEKK